MKRVLVLGLVVLLVIGSAVAASSRTPEWIVYDTANSGLPSGCVQALAIDEQGNKWIGTDGGGLAVYREGGVILTGVLAAAEPDTSRPVGKELFTIGQEDKSYYEFRSTGFRGQPEYTCRVKVGYKADCAAEAFPLRLYRAPIPSYADDGVERIAIIFTLDHDYNEVVLRLARAGAETAVVTVDGKRTHLVTNTMLGSNEHTIFGAYNLTLGALNKGIHTIQLTLADDGKGNGRHSWDALALFAR